jgi:hypothetical protein
MKKETGNKHLPGILSEGKKWCRSRKGIAVQAAAKKSIKAAESKEAKKSK